MREGYWINYSNGKVFLIDEHEQWLRSPGNAKKLGVPQSVIAMFKKFKPVIDRDKFLLFVMQHAPVMRARGHGSHISFEYASHTRQEPLDAILMFGRKNLGPLSNLYIVNFATKETAQMTFQGFEENMDRSGYEGVMRVAAIKLSMNKRIIAELLALSKELLKGDD